VVGHVDHGKSTLLGRLLAETGALPQGRLEQLQEKSRRESRPFEYAHLLDSLKDEQSQGITIDTTRVFFRTPKRRYMVQDAPGHLEFLRNMITGAARADAAIVVIDASQGVRENSRRHGLLLSLLGIRQIAVVVNKMDLVQHSERSFIEIQEEYSRFLKSFDIKPKCFVPAAAKNGENLCERAAEMPWYLGPTLLEAIESFQSLANEHLLPFRMPVQDVYRFTEKDDSRPVIAGAVESGELRASDGIIFYPSGKRSMIESFLTFQAPAPEAIRAGDAAGFRLVDPICIERGEIACRPDEPSPRITSLFAASVFWLGARPLAIGSKYVLKSGTAKRKAELLSVKNVVDAGRFEAADKKSVSAGEVAECVFRLDRDIAVELASSHPTLCRFVLFDDYELAGGGIIRQTS
jgi:bifunctional enzyme CysN/CysC